jgi:large exoprotein involved in heme utilization and adhesion
MKRILIIAAAALGLMGGTLALAQAKPDVIGTWTGNAVVGGDGSQIEITLVLERTDLGYAGKISDSSGFVPETALREIVFRDNKLTFELDLAQPSGTTLIKIELLYDKDTLKGIWYDPDGNSGAIELAMGK